MKTDKQIYNYLYLKIWCHYYYTLHIALLYIAGCKKKINVTLIADNVLGCLNSECVNY